MDLQKTESFSVFNLNTTSLEANRGPEFNLHKSRVET